LRKLTLGPEAEAGASGSRPISSTMNWEESPNTIGQGALRVLSETVQSISDLESEGSAGNILQKRKVSQKTHIPISSQEEIERMVKKVA